MYTSNTLKNITLSAPEELIEAARRKAAAQGTTLNQEFRNWLTAQTIDHEERLVRYKQLLKQISHANAGRSFTREEMNER